MTEKPLSVTISTIELHFKSMEKSVVLSVLINYETYLSQELNFLTVKFIDVSV